MYDVVLELCHCVLAIPLMIINIAVIVVLSLIHPSFKKEGRYIMEIWVHLPKSIFVTIREYYGSRAFEAEKDRRSLFPECKRARTKEDCLTALFIIRMASPSLQKMSEMDDARDWESRRSLLESVLVHWNKEARSLFLKYCIQKADDLTKHIYGLTYEDKRQLFTEVCESHVQNIQRATDERHKEEVIHYHYTYGDWLTEFRKYLCPESYVFMIECAFGPRCSRWVLEGIDFEKFSLPLRRRIFEWFRKVNPRSSEPNFTLHFGWFVYNYGATIGALPSLVKIYDDKAKKEYGLWRLFCTPLVKELVKEVLESKSPAEKIAEYKIDAEWCKHWMNRTTYDDIKRMASVTGIKLSSKSHKKRRKEK